MLSGVFIYEKQREIVLSEIHIYHLIRIYISIILVSINTIKLSRNAHTICHNKRRILSLLNERKEMQRLHPENILESQSYLSAIPHRLLLNDSASPLALRFGPLLGCVWGGQGVEARLMPVASLEQTPAFRNEPGGRWPQCIMGSGGERLAWT